MPSPAAAPVSTENACPGFWRLGVERAGEGTDMDVGLPCCGVRVPARRLGVEWRSSGAGRRREGVVEGGVCGKGGPAMGEEPRVGWEARRRGCCCGGYGVKFCGAPRSSPGDRWTELRWSPFEVAGEADEEGPEKE